ncbi:GNAT family N-acetyltransferase [Tropicibacter sp. R16_0]|uniref:GNAT family N-acetyltransferase n=1 Tax=Tropicibacter sp. R16_0 TaxID=2821102 RepID=UPI001ADD46A7|nr:GNAT family N-acetyltransferase [Tropicibacter sp. R16_0]MBO9449546.1 GNAT family N-acetyltransferase [Tropicibacter sp. R16_0]
MFRLDTGRAFDHVRPIFERVHAADADAGVHLSWPWLRSLLHDYPGRCRIYALSPTGRIRDARAFLPLRRDLHWSETRQEFVTRYAAMGMLNIADYTGFVCSDDAVIGAFAQALQAEPWARLSLRFEATGRRARSLAAGFDPAEVAVKWPGSHSSNGSIDNLLCPRIAVPKTPQDYVAQLSKKMRKKYRRAQRQADGMGAKMHLSAPHQQAAHLALILEQWSNFWNGKKPDESIRRLKARYHEHLIRAMQMGNLQLITLWAGDHFLGGTANLIDRELAILHSVAEGRDDTAGVDVGILLSVEMVTRAAQMRMAWVDLGHGDYDYKYRLGAQDRSVSYLTLRRRSRSRAMQFDPAMSPFAVKATREFIRAQDPDKARAAMAQLRRHALG